MREFKKIEDEIQANRRKKENFKAKKKTSVYWADNEAHWPGIRTFIWSAIGRLLILGFAGEAVEAKYDIDEYLRCYAFLIVLASFAIVAAVKFFKERISFSVARVFTVVSGIIMFISVIDFFAAGTIAAFLWTHIIFLILVIAMFIESLIKLTQEKHKKDSAQEKCNELELKIIDCDKHIKLLNEELKETKQEAQRQFREEIAKAQPNIEKMEFLAKIGVPTAKEWAIDVHRKIFNEEIKNDSPDIEKIKRAADFECPEASLYYAKWVFNQYSEDIIKDDSIFENKEKKKICLTAQPYFKTAALAGNAEAKAYYYYTVERLGVHDYGEYGRYAYNWDELCLLRDKLKALIDSNLLDNYTTRMCKNCLEHIEMGLDTIRALRCRLEREKNAGFYSDLGSYQSARAHYSGSSSSSSSNREGAPEFYYPIDVSGM